MKSPPTTEDENADIHFLERKWLSLIIGFTDIEDVSYKRTYKLYIAFIFLLYGYYMFACTGTLLYVPSDKELFVKTIHVMILIIWACLMTVCKITMRGSLRRMKLALASGIYKYDGEEPDEAGVNIKREGLKSLKSRSNLLFRLYLFSGFSNLVMYPLTQLLTIDEDTSDKILNPYLSMPLYMPFNTRTPVGYSLGVLFNLIYPVLVYGGATVMNDIFISYTGGISAQIRLLNHSLTTLETRARKVYRRGRSDLAGRSNSATFQDVMVSCLSANVRHHITLAEFKKLGVLYIGSTWFLVISVCSMVLATTCSLLLESMPANKFANILFQAVSECAYPFMLCYFGEDVIHESSKILGSLYETPWIEANQRFKQQALIMMANTMKPMSIRSFFMGFAASLRTFGDIISNMYKVINVIRQEK